MRPTTVARCGDASLGLFARGSEPGSVIVFIHGIAGDAIGSWGAEGEPGTFPRRMAAAIPAADIVLGGYRSDLDSIFDDDALTLESLIEDWKTVLSEHVLSRFGKVFFVTHCLGGLLTTMAVRRLVQAGEHLPATRFLLLETLHVLPPKHACREGTGGIMLALDCRASEFAENVAFWTPVFEGRRALPFDFHAEVVIGLLEGFIAPWRPDAFFPASSITRCGLLHDALSRPPRESPFLPLDRAVRMGRLFFG